MEYGFTNLEPKSLEQIEGNDFEEFCEELLQVRLFSQLLLSVALERSLCAVENGDDLLWLVRQL